MTERHETEHIEDLSWIGLISKAVTERELFGSTCHLYSREEETNAKNTPDPCVCGRRLRFHSFEQNPLTNLRESKSWEKFEHATEVPVSVYGIWNNKTKFVRWDHTRTTMNAVTSTTTENKEPKTSLSTMAEILKIDANNKNPDLLISCYGGAKYFKMNDKLEKEFMEGIGLAAATEGVWILTAGLNSGISKVIGQSVERYALLNEKPSTHTVIGLSSWGCLSDRTRHVLRKQAQADLAENKTRRTSIPKMQAPLLLRRDKDDDIASWSTLDENQPDTFENNHTHLLLLDDGSQGERCTSTITERFYITDKPRSIFVEELKKLTQCHTVTILVEGGLNSLEIIRHDLDAERPVVIIHGSGRLATAIGNLLELTYNHSTVGKDEVERQFKSVTTLLHNRNERLSEQIFSNIQFILLPKNRAYLTLFRLSDKTSLTDTIFLAVFKAHMHRENTNIQIDHVKKMLDLAVKWNYVDGINEFENTEIFKNNPMWNVDLFEKALITNRPAFVDYFLRRQYDVLETSEYINFKKTPDRNMAQDIIASLRAAILTLQVDRNKIRIQADHSKQQSLTLDDITKYEIDEANIRASYALKFLITHLYRITNEHRKNSDHVYSLSDLDHLYYRLIGPYAESFFRVRSASDRLEIDLRTKLHSLYKRLICLKKYTTVSPYQPPEKPHWSDLNRENSQGQDPSKLPAIVMITGLDPVQINLERFAIAKTFGNQEMLRDIFLWAVVEGYSEMAFVLLLQLKSRISAALVATGITDRLMSTSDSYLDRVHKFQKQSNDYERFATACIDDCYKRSERRACQLLLREIPLFGNITCMQVAIHFRIRSFINSRCFDQVLNRQWCGVLRETTNQSWEGIKDQDGTKLNYFQKVREFHQTRIHWTEIYVIITISAMLIEDIRKHLFEYLTQMLERWHQTDVWMLGVYALPYVLFYIGIGLKFVSRTRSDLFTSARIILAIDLEVWFLFSLRFVSAIKLLGPKLFMIRNMLRDLIGFIYIIFVCIAAYGIVSRSLTRYANIELNAKHLSASILYRPYWFLYSIVDDERQDLDDIIDSESSTKDAIAEATINHILLAFHMLFINILILNLLIAVFNFTINDVQEKSEYFWRYQRYELIRDYFEQPLFAYPPLSIVGYFCTLIKYCLRRGNVVRVFKRLATKQMDCDWTDFENAATYNYTRTFVDRMYCDSSTLIVPTFSETDELKAEIENLKRKSNQMRTVIDSLNAQSKQSIPAMNWIMTAMDRVKMSSQRPPPIVTISTSDT
ncbi:hypothetical protein I4U23_012235 [Adineta vaga]|nr:hypothetical protein I4U23_012235 [Adineta vaga]